MKTQANSEHNSAKTDWAEADRKRFLRCVPNAKKNRNATSSGVNVESVWMQDVSASDRRSVKAYLAGRGDCRVTWWNLNASMHRILRPASSLESAMYHFHKRHGEFTLWRLAVAKDFWTVFAAVKGRDVQAVVSFVHNQLQAVVKAKR